MKTDRNEKKETGKSLKTFGGIGVCLLTLIMTVNIGYPARGLTFVPSYLFGTGAYFLYATFYILGMGMIFHSRVGFFRKFRNVAGLFLVFLGYCIICSAAYTPSLGTDFRYDSIYGSGISFASGYFGNDSFLGLFSEHAYGGGKIGYLLSDLLKNCGGLWCSYLVGVVIALLGLSLIFYPIVIQLVQKANKNRSGALSGAESEEDNSIESYAEKDRSGIRVKNYNVIRDAKKTAPEDLAEEKDENVSPSSCSSVPGGSYSYSYSKDIGRLTKAMFSLDGESDKDELGSYSEPVNARAFFEDESMPKPPAEQPTSVTPSVPAETVTESPAGHEQLDIFENQQPIDESLVSRKPEFQTPVAAVAAPLKRPTPPKPGNVVFVKDISEIRPQKWTPPTVDFLTVYANEDKNAENRQVAEERVVAINQVFDNLLNGGARVEDYTVGPGVTRFNVRCNENTPVRKVAGIINDISIRLKGAAVRFEPIVEGQSTSGLEAPNAQIATVSFKEIYEGLPDVKKHPLSVGFGKNISGNIIYADFNEFPHLLVAGTTGSGKSVFVNSVICTLIMRNSPEDLKLVLIDPKKIEMSRYNDMPHLLTPVITEAPKAKAIMDKLVTEMNDRYELFMQADNCTDIKDYNSSCQDYGLPKMPYIVAVLDEYADLVNSCKDIAKPVVLLGQKARACGIHILISTQRPSTDVITGVIKANLPTRVALSVSSQVDSMTVLGEAGAEKLLGKGDMLVMSPLISRSGFSRVQGCFMNKHEMNEVVRYLKENYITYYQEKFVNLEDEGEMDGKNLADSPEFTSHGGADDEESKYQEVKEWVMANAYMSMSKIQRGCAVGFNRAGRFFERLQDEGIVDTAVEGNKGCRVLKRDIDETNGDVPTSIDMSEK